MNRARAAALLVTGSFAACVQPEPWTVPEGITDITILAFDEDGALLQASPFQAWNPPEPLSLRGANHGRWMLVGYGPIQGQRLTGQVPLPATLLDPALPPPPYAAAGPDYERADPPLLRLATPSCPAPGPDRAVSVSCPGVYGWEVPMVDDRCGWTTLPERVGFEVPFPGLEGVVETDGRLRPTRVQGEDAPCSTAAPLTCPSRRGMCEVAIDAPAPTDSVDVLQGLYPPRRLLPDRCRTARPLDNQVGPLRDIEWGVQPWVALLRDRPYTNCSASACPPRGTMRSLDATTGEVSSEASGRFDRVFDIPGRDDLVGVVERKGNVEGCDTTSAVWLLPGEGGLWEVQARRRADLSVVASVQLSPANPELRTKNVLAAQGLSPHRALLVVEDRQSFMDKAHPRMVRVELRGESLSLTELPEPDLGGGFYGIEQIGEDLAIHAEDNWRICPRAWFDDPESHECQRFAIEERRSNLIEGIILDGRRRLVSDRDSLAVTDGVDVETRISLVVDVGRDGARDLMRLNARYVAAAINSQPDGVFTTSLVWFDLQEPRRLLPGRIPLGPGWTTRMAIIDGELLIMNAMEGKVVRVAEWPR